MCKWPWWWSLSIPSGLKGACEWAARTPSQATEGVFTRLLPACPVPGGSCPKRRPGGCCTQLGSPSALKHAVLGLYLLVFLLLVGIFILAGKHAPLLCESLWALCAFSHGASLSWKTGVGVEGHGVGSSSRQGSGLCSWLAECTCAGNSRFRHPSLPVERGALDAPCRVALQFST